MFRYYFDRTLFWKLLLHRPISRKIFFAHSRTLKLWCLWKLTCTFLYVIVFVVAWALNLNLFLWRSLTGIHKLFTRGLNWLLRFLDARVPLYLGQIRCFTLIMVQLGHAFRRYVSFSKAIQTFNWLSRLVLLGRVVVWLHLRRAVRLFCGFATRGWRCMVLRRALYYLFDQFGGGFRFYAA